MRNSLISLNKFTLIISLLATISFASQALRTSDAVDQIKLVRPTESIETIMVTGSRSLKFFKNQVTKAEEDFFTTLNTFASEESFEIECRMKTKAFTRIRVRVCEPKYAGEITYETTNIALGVVGRLKDNLAGRFAEGLNVEMQIAKKHRAHLAIVKEVVKNNPELQTKLLHLVETRYALEQKKMSVFGETAAYKKMTKNIESITQTQSLVE